MGATPIVRVEAFVLVFEVALDTYHESQSELCSSIAPRKRTKGKNYSAKRKYSICFSMKVPVDTVCSTSSPRRPNHFSVKCFQCQVDPPLFYLYTNGARSTSMTRKTIHGRQRIKAPHFTDLAFYRDANTRTGFQNQGSHVFGVRNLRGRACV